MGKNSFLALGFAATSNRVLLVGPVPASGATWKRALRDAAGSKIIAVDGGLDHCLNRGLKVDLAMGDFDSTRLDESAIKELGSGFVRFRKDKDRSDLGLALDFLKTWNSGKSFEVFTIGFLGGDHSHHLASVLEFSKASPDLKSIHCFSDSNDLVFLSGHLGFRYEAKVSLGQKISIFSVDSSDHILSLEGFKYSLKKAKLQNPSHGLNNQSIKNTIRVTLEKGQICLVFSR